VDKPSSPGHTLISQNLVYTQKKSVAPGGVAKFSLTKKLLIPTGFQLQKWVDTLLPPTLIKGKFYTNLGERQLELETKSLEKPFPLKDPPLIPNFPTLGKGGFKALFLGTS